MAMGGGSFTFTNKVLPGSYINFISTASAAASPGDRGTAALALSLPWGPEREIMTVSSSDFYNRSKELFGRGYTHEDLMALREVFCYAKTCYALALQMDNKLDLISLRGQVQTANFRRSVVALCSLDNSEIGLNSYSIGKVVVQQDDGKSHVMEADLGIEKYYNSDKVYGYIDLVSGDPASYAKLCRFTYNGKLYGGLEFYYSDDQAQNVFFTGITNLSIFGLDFYDHALNTPINAEVYNSLDYDSAAYMADWTHNGDTVGLSCGQYTRRVNGSGRDCAAL